MNFSDDPFKPSAIIQGHEIVIANKLCIKSGSLSACWPHCARIESAANKITLRCNMYIVQIEYATSQHTTCKGECP
jgi:hypothetical protein